jgi:hypothetical protein
MSDIVFLQAYVDFRSSDPLADVARKIADACFPGRTFVGQDEGIWDEVPALRLDRIVLGLESIVGGTPGSSGGYTIQVSSRKPYGGDIPTDTKESQASICDFSGYMAGLLKEVDGIELLPKPHDLQVD